MKRITKCLQTLNPMEISLFAVLIFTFLSFCRSVDNMIDDLNTGSFGIIGGSSGDAFGILSFLQTDILITVLIFMIFVVICVFLKTKQARFLFFAVVFLFFLMLMSDTLSSNLSSIVICIFALYQIRKNQGNTKKEIMRDHIWRVLFVCYFFPVIILAGVWIFPQEEGSNNTQLDLLFVAYGFFIVCAFILMYFAIKRDGVRLSKYSAVAFLLAQLCLMAVYGFMEALPQFLVLPEGLLSIYVLVKKERKKGEQARRKIFFEKNLL